jgi:hypothetical protein
MRKIALFVVPAVVLAGIRALGRGLKRHRSQDRSQNS